ncbi:MAG: hypothetical protein U0361_20525 [Nitrospiraceae bacterium]
MVARALRCEFCHRIQQQEASMAQDGSDSSPSPRHGLLQEFMLYEGLCAQCEGFYHQLVTYGRPQDPRASQAAAEAHL